MLTYEPDETLAHRLDPRTKLAVQIGFAATALAHTTPRTLAVLSVVTALVLFGAHVSIRRTLVDYRFALLLILALAPLIAGVTLGAPWFDTADAIASGLASYRVLLILLVSAAYVRSTPVRDSRAAIQRTIPGNRASSSGSASRSSFGFCLSCRAISGRSARRWPPDSEPNGARSTAPARSGSSA